MLKTIFLCRSAIARTSYRSLVALTRVLAKNDFSTIESYRLPSQTSINEWEFKYDFVPKVSEPKVPPVSQSAIQQEKAEIKKQQMEHELLTRELNTSIKVEANDASVVHGGESVCTEPELPQGCGSDPLDAHALGKKTQAKKVDVYKYQQLSLNEDINNPAVVNLGHSNVVESSLGTVDAPPKIDDAEESESFTVSKEQGAKIQEARIQEARIQEARLKQESTREESSSEEETSLGANPVVMLSLLSAGGLAGFYSLHYKGKK